MNTRENQQGSAVFKTARAAGRIAALFSAVLLSLACLNACGQKPGNHRSDVPPPEEEGTRDNTPLVLEPVQEGKQTEGTDEVELDVVPSGEDVYIVDGGTTIDDFFESVDYHPPEDFETEYDTMGGWAIERLDRFPVAGDHFVYDIFDVTVLEAEAMRVDKLRVKIMKKEEEE